MNEANNILETNFSGLRLRSPIIAASAPPTESVKAIVSCAKAGIGAVVTKSIADYQRVVGSQTPRRSRRDRRGFWIQGSFESETLTLVEGIDLVKAARDAVDIPIIASVGVQDAKGQDAIEAACHLVEAGAQMIHFDLFYLPQPRANDATLAALRQFFEKSAAMLSVPFAPKLNLDIPAELFAQAFDSSRLPNIFLLDSIRVPPPVSIDGRGEIPFLEGGLECSLFGAWQKPISLHYTRVLADAGFISICSGGGFSSAEDIAEAVILGATAVQIATPIMVHGFDWIRRTTDSLAELVSATGVSNVGALRGIALRERSRIGKERAKPALAVIDASVCQPCGVCTKLAFCDFIHMGEDGYPTIAPDCYGCGFCESLCPHSGAIRMESA